MRYNRILTITAACAVMAAGCTRVEIAGPSSAATLTLTVPATELTRANNGTTEENKLESVYYYIYSDSDHTAPVIAGNLNSESPVDGGSYELDLTDAQYTALGTTGYIYILANADPASLGISSSPSESALKAAVVETDFTEAQSSFVMVYDGTFTITDKQFTIEALLKRLASKLTVVAKVSKPVEFAGADWEPQLDGMTVNFYKAMNQTTLETTSSTAIDANLDLLKDASSPASLLDLGPVEFEKAPADPANPAEGEAEIKTGANGDYYETETLDAFYTYPMNRKFYEQYLKIEIPWKNGSDIKTCSYVVILNMDEFQPNAWYEVSIDVDKLANTTIGLNGKYSIKDWGKNDPPLTMDIMDTRFLVVDQNNYTMDDIEDLTIPFVTSHPCKFEVLQASTTRISTEKSTSGQTMTIYVNRPADLFTLDDSANTLSIKHEINDDVDDYALDVAPYVFKVRLSHIDDPSYYQDITITQYPAVVISAQKNIYNFDDNAGDKWSGKEWHGYTYVNGPRTNMTAAYVGSSSNPDKYENQIGDAKDLTYNYIHFRKDQRYYCMYVIETKSVPNGSKYVLADPRESTPNYVATPAYINGSGEKWGDISGRNGKIFDSGNSNLNYKYDDGSINTYPGMYSAPSMYNNNTTYPEGNGAARKMQWYYATYSDSEHENYIAPKFRISSAFSSSGNLMQNADASKYHTYLSMVQRCAAYQEDGYPAGRWRLPTYAECEYVVKLQQLGLIPELFTAESPDNGMGYWCASCGIRYQSNSQPLSKVTFGTAVNNASQSDLDKTKGQIRCVYDEWYWENTDINRLPESKYNQFTWGDMPR